MGQDRLVEVWDTMKEIMRRNHLEYECIERDFVNEQTAKFPNARMFDVTEICNTKLNIALEELLSITLRRGGGVCNKCGGVGLVWLGGNSNSLSSCLRCHGTGKLPEETITLKELIEKWQNND